MPRKAPVRFMKYTLKLEEVEKATKEIKAIKEDAEYYIQAKLGVIIYFPVEKGAKCKYAWCEINGKLYGSTFSNKIKGSK